MGHPLNYDSFANEALQRFKNPCRRKTSSKKRRILYTALLKLNPGHDIHCPWYAYSVAEKLFECLENSLPARSYRSVYIFHF